MPDVEDLTMHLAGHFKIHTCDHALIPTTKGEMAYLTKRFDRVNGKKFMLKTCARLVAFKQNRNMIVLMNDVVS